MKVAITTGIESRDINTQHPRLDVNKKADRKAIFLLADPDGDRIEGP